MVAVDGFRWMMRSEVDDGDICSHLASVVTNFLSFLRWIWIWFGGGSFVSMLVIMLFSRMGVVLLDIIFFFMGSIFFFS